MFKVGDTVWTIAAGYCKITHISGGSYPIMTDDAETYTLEGKALVTDKLPSLFPCKPKIKNKKVVEEGYLNFYTEGAPVFHRTEEEANRSAGSWRVKCVPCTLTYKVLQWES